MHILIMPFSGWELTRRFLQSFPEDHQKYPFFIAGKELRVCHRDPSTQVDGIYQEASDELGFLTEGRYTSRSEPKFQEYVDRFHLPFSTGLSLGSWHLLYQQLFPGGVSQGDFQSFNALFEHAGRRGIKLQEVLPLAKQIRAYRETSGQASREDWPAMLPSEKIFALYIALFLKGAEQDPSFYLAQNAQGIQENKAFIDTALRKLGEGKIAVQDISERQEWANGIASEYAAYDIPKNHLFFSLKTPFEPLNIESHISHELFHLYQDDQKQRLSLEDVEATAYLKGTEYLIHLLEKISLVKPGYTADEVVEKIWDHPGPLASEAVHAAYYQKQGNQRLYEEHLKELKLAINAFYYIHHVVDAYSANFEAFQVSLNQQIRQDKSLLPRQITALQEQREQALAKIREIVKIPPTSFTPALVDQMDKAFATAYIASTTLFSLEALASSKDPENFPTQDEEENVLTRTDGLYRELAEFSPAAYIPAKMDGLD